MNRRKNTLGILPLLATVLLSAASCTESVVQDMETAGDSGAIRFSLPTLTRSAIGSADDLNTDGQSFSVWGSYRHTSGTDNDVQIFDNTTVTYGSGTGWTYGGGLLYWQSGNTYDFYALYPSTGTLGDAVSVACTDGTFTVKNFVATKGHDLMTAERTNIVIEADKAPESVSFKFSHRLTRLAFNIRAVGRGVTVTSFKVNGVTYKGDLTWNASGGSEQHRQDKRQRCPVGRKGYFHHSRRDPQHAGRRAVTPAHRPDWYRNRRELPFRGRDRRPEFHGQPLWRECETMGCRQPICLHPDRFGRFARNQREGSRLG